jgi:hypothetical protein
MNGKFTMGKLKSSLLSLSFVLNQTDTFNMLEFLIGNIFVMFGGRVFQQTVGIPMDTNCALLLADLFLYSYEADFIQGSFLDSSNPPSRKS